MLEVPEILTMVAQLNEAVVGKVVQHVFPPTKEHKFCTFNGEASEYNSKIQGQKIIMAEGFGMFVELGFANDQRLCFSDGTNARLVKEAEAPKAYQLMISFTDGYALVFTVSMYGGIILHGGDYNSEYYITSRASISPFSKDFEPYYRKLLQNSKNTLSVKAFLATEQRIPGIGNGVLQDIIFNAGLHPKSKLQSLSDEDKDRLYNSIVSTLRAMAEKGGRDTWKDLYGNTGGYVTLMSKNSIKNGCSVCGGDITKEAYLGGSVYYCKRCQPI